MNLVTRMDFDGIVCAAMLMDVESVPAINFADPKDIEDGGLLDILHPGDIIANLPYHPDCGVWFHHHEVPASEAAKIKARGKWGLAASSSRQVFDFYTKAKLGRYENLVGIADRVSSAALTKEDILSPTGWIMVAYTLDPRFSKDYAFGMEILTGIKAGKDAAQILAIPTVAKRVELYKKDEATYQEMLDRYTSIDGNIIITDFREVDRAPTGNRFYAFTKYPEGNVHVRLDAASGLRIKLSVSKSIFNKSSKVHVGKLMEEYGGGGPAGAGTCHVGRRTQHERIPEILNKLR